jgi:hypothetical protein
MRRKVTVISTKVDSTKVATLAFVRSELRGYKTPVVMLDELSFFTLPSNHINFIYVTQPWMK